MLPSEAPRSRPCANATRHVNDLSPARTAMKYQYLKARGALNEATTGPAPPAAALVRAGSSPELLARLHGQIDAAILELIPESVARENLIVPLALDGDMLICAAVKADD